MSSHGVSSTNTEMLADFTATSRDVYVSAFKNAILENIPPAFEGKFVSDIYYDHTKVYPPTHEQTTRPVLSKEQLTISPLLQDTVEMLKEGDRQLPQDTLGCYGNIALTLSQTVIGPGLAIDSILPVEGINATYVAHLRDSKNVRRTSTFEEKPTKIGVTSGKLLTEEALQYVGVYDIVQDNVEEYLKTGEITSPVVSHGFSFRMTPDLALNGYEPKDFLEKYFAAMMKSAENNERILRESQGAKMPSVITQNLEEKYNKALAAARRAQQYLEH